MVKEEQVNTRGATKWDKSTKIVLIGGAFVLFVWCASLVAALKVKAPVVASFGDVFEAASALFSGLAFVGLVYTIMLQRQELAFQRQELADTRREIAEQNRHFEQQNKTLRQQAADNTFFQLLALHNDIVKAIDLRLIEDGQIVALGRDCFEKLYADFVNDYKQLTPYGGAEIEVIQKSYEAFYERRQADVGHYFRSLYNIVKFVDRSEFNDKRIYTNLVRAQLSSYEQTLLFYNCLTKYGQEKFKPLVEKYGLLKHIPRDLLINEEPRLNYYAATAYS